MRAEHADDSWSATRTLVGEDVRCLAADRGVVFAGTRDRGVFRSKDGGRTWARAGLNGHLVRSLAVSDDDGRTWKRLRGGLQHRYGWSVAVSGDRLYLTVAPYLAAHTGNSRACVLRAGGNHPWERTTADLPSLPRLRSTSGGDVFAALGDGTLLLSADEGRRWNRVPVDLGGASAALLALD